jgi:hypothetical protein
MSKERIQKNGSEGSLCPKNERAIFKILTLSVALLAMRVHDAKRNELLGSVRALLKDDRLKAARITDVLTQ